MLLNGDQAELYAGSKGGLLVVWDLESCKVKANLSGHKSQITSLYLSKVKNAPYMLASGSQDGKLKIWDARNYKNSSLNFKGHFESIRAISISPDCNYIASGSEDKLCRLWDIRQNKLIKEFSILDQGVVNCIEFNPHCITLAYGTSDRTVKHWDLERYQLISVTPVDRLPISKIKFDSSGKNLYSATSDTLKYWMVDDESPILNDNIECGWNKLQDMQYINDDGIYGISIYGTKIALWHMPEKGSNSRSNSTKEVSNILDSISNINLSNDKIIVQNNYVINNIVRIYLLTIRNK